MRQECFLRSDPGGPIYDFTKIGPNLKICFAEIRFYGRHRKNCEKSLISFGTIIQSSIFDVLS